MDSVATMSDQERADLFRETGARMGLPAALVEKDFWVCWTLKQLFEIEGVRDALMFKGGTSLSKVFGLIDRFSEDIDIAVDYALLGFTGDRDPAADMSRTGRQRLLAEMMAACRSYVEGPFTDAFCDRSIEVLGDSKAWSIAASPHDANTVEFAYPSAGLDHLEYIQPRILLELGTHAELIPSGSFEITPFAAEQFPSVFKKSACPLKAILAERTFWEKGTILHAERHRQQDKAFPAGYARHYYDLARLAESPVAKSAVADIDLLRRVVDHKEKFYYAAWARYDLAVPGTIALAPSDNRIRELRRDYEAMSVMIFGDPPPLEELLDTLARLEARINGSSTPT